MRVSLLKSISLWNRKRLAQRRARKQWLLHPDHPHLPYDDWIKQFDTIDARRLEIFRLRAGRIEHGPRISVLMPVFNPDIQHLREAIASVKEQVYPHWELCIADDASTDPAVRTELEHQARGDARIRLTFRNENGHICAASNSALDLATGHYVALLDQDDLLRPHSLLFVAEAITLNPDAGVIYSDEDKITDSGARFDPYFKPDWNLFLLRGQNYISHLGVYRRDLIEAAGRFRPGYEGSQDYDLVLRCIERLRDDQIIHLPFILYHWRAHPASTASATSAKPYAIDAAVRSLTDHLQRTSTRGKVEREGHDYCVRYTPPHPAPSVAILIPTRDRLDLLEPCVSSILTKTTHPDFEIIIIDNGSEAADTLAYLDALKQHPKVKVLRDDNPFNYSRLNNLAARGASADFLCLVNNDIEVIDGNWLTEMLALGSQPTVGAVGAKLLYGNGLLQHGGVILGIGSVASHAELLAPPEWPGYFKRLVKPSELSAATGACLLVRAAAYASVQGLDEEHLAIAFNDVDFCLKLRQAGYRVLFCPFAVLYHHESASRGRDNAPPKAARFALEASYMLHRWGAVLPHDPAHNPNLSLQSTSFILAHPPRVSLDDPYWLHRRHPPFFNRNDGGPSK